MAPFVGTFGQPRSLCGVLALIAVVTTFVRTLAAEEPAATDADAGPSSKTEIVNAMQEVRRKYGSDAVLLQGHLLSHAVRNGSVGEVVVSVGGVEEHDGKRFLTFGLQTGIVYNDREVSAANRPARAWSEVVEPSLRTFHSLTVPADGIVLRLDYAHRNYMDEAELRTHLRDQPGTPESAAFYLLLADIGDLLADRITGQQLIGRSAVLLNGAGAQVVLPAPTPTPAGEASRD